MREDFFYRIKVVSLTIPPLRDRREDIPLLVPHLLEKIARREGHPGPPSVSGGALRLLMNHNWPGNVRELENALEHAMVLSRGETILGSHLPPELRRIEARREKKLRDVPMHSDQEQNVLREALRGAGWNRSKAARRLGIDRTTLWRKIKEYGLEPED